MNLFSGKLDCDSLLSCAEKKTHRTDWGDLEFQEPFRILIESLQKETRLSHRGKFVVTQHYSRLLRNILKIVEDWKRYPDIAKVELKDPIFILGFPRTGTTYLHSLLTQEPTFRSLKYWELLFPSPPPDPKMYNSNSRIWQARQFVFWINKISPPLAAIHELKATGAEECCFIFDHFFLDNIHDLVFHVPSYIQWYRQHDPVPSYRFHRRMLQYYGWKFSFDRFVLKAPRHLFCLDALLQVYPNASIIWTHRDPVTAIPSLCSLSETARRIVSDDVSKSRIGKLCLEYFENDFKAGFHARQKANPKQFYDVSYQELVYHPIETVQRIYDYFGFSYTPLLDANLRGIIRDTHARPPARHHYTLEEYQLNPDEIRERLHGYYETFARLMSSERS